MTKSYTELAPAKINVGLRILNKRKDKYHNLETIFYPVNIFDKIRLSISKLSGTTPTVIKVNVSPDLKIKSKDNICYKTAELFLEKFKIEGSYSITINIKKNIPVGAGLGGGSSDAASVLKILAKHFKVEQHHKYFLNLIAFELGSDVPFFLIAKPAYAENRGEKLTELGDFVIKQNILIINPGINVSTKWAYKQVSKIVSEWWNKKYLKKIKSFNILKTGRIINHFEKVVFKKYPAIKKIKEDMYKTGAGFSLMSGSGSSVFGLYKEKADMESAINYFKKTKYKIFVS